MRRFFALSLATTLLGGCSSKETPAQPSSTVDAGLAVRPQEAPPRPAPLLPEPPKEPTAFDKATQFHAQGRAQGEAGNFQEALKLFAQARELAPEWPMPVYDTALTYLLMGDAAKALPVYEQVDKMAPQGFSDTKRVVECLRREKAGRVPKGTFRKFIDVMRLRDARELERRLEELTRTAPHFYPAWHEFIGFGKDSDERMRRLEKTLTLKPEVGTRGQLLLYKAQLLREGGKLEESRKLLQSLIDDPQSLPNTVAEAREALSINLAPPGAVAAPMP
jgi:tetratricopeptide (TPR) repeat protein